MKVKTDAMYPRLTMTPALLQEVQNLDEKAELTTLFKHYGAHNKYFYFPLSIAARFTATQATEEESVGIRRSKLYFKC
jgi:hypothetical protein